MHAYRGMHRHSFVEPDLPGARARAGDVLRLLGLRHVALAASWLVITLECGFPAALVAPELAIALLTIAGTFHVGNALVLGLNRFVWAWLAAYPALLYWVR